MASLFDILINVGANTASFESGMDKIESRLKSFGDVVKGAFEFTGVTVGLESLRAGLSSAAESGEQLTQLSTRLGTTVQSLSQLQYATQTVNVPFSALTSSLDLLQRNLVQTADGTGKAKQAFADLGIDAAKLAKLPLDAQLDIIADRIAALPSATQQTAAAMRLLGDAGSALLPFLREGSDGIDQLRQRADALGVTLSGDAAESLAKYNSAMTDLQATSHALWTEIAVDSAPALTSFTGAITKSIKDARETFDGIAGMGSATSQVAGLTKQAQELTDRIDGLKARGGGWLLSLVDRTLISQDEALLAGLQKKITDLTPLDPVKVTAKLIGGGVNDTEQLPQINFFGNDAMYAEWQDKLYAATRTMTQQTADQWSKQEEDVRVALANNVIDATQAAAKIQDLNNQYLQPVEVTAKLIGRAGKSVYTDLQKYAEQAANSIQSSFASFLEDPTIAGFKRLEVSWVQTLAKMLADAETSQLFKSIFGDGAGLAGLLDGQGITGGLLADIFGLGSSASLSLGASASAGATTALNGALGTVAPLFGFANGGSFNVGGSGAVDSQLVAFKATPGEHVQVGGGGGGGAIQVINNVNLTSPQVTQNDVLAAMRQTQASTVAQIQDMQRRRRL